MKIHVSRLQQMWNNVSALGYTVDVVSNDSPIRLDLLTGATISAVAHLFGVVAVGPFDLLDFIYRRQIDPLLLALARVPRCRRRSCRGYRADHRPALAEQAGDHLRPRCG